MRPEALYTAHPAPDNRTKFAAQKPEGIKNVICRNYKRFSPSRCELPDKKCIHGYLHKSSTCNQLNCKALNHESNAHPSRNYAPRSSVRFAPSNSNASLYANNSRMSSQVSANIVEPSDSLSLNSVKQIISESLASLKQDITTSILNEVEKRRFLLLIQVIIVRVL